MSNISIYQDIDFSLYRAYSYTLLLRIEETSFSYAIVQYRRLMALAQDCDLLELNSPNELADILSADYNKIIVGLPASGFTLIPENLFDDKHAVSFARYLDVRPEEKVLVLPFDNENLIMFKTNEDLVSPMERSGTNLLVYTYRGWLQSIAKSSPLNNNLYVDINKNKAHFLNFTSGILRFYNSFEFKSEDDLVYYTAFVAEELHLRPQHITLLLSGDIEKGDANITRLGKFYPNIEINGLQPIEFPSELPANQYLAISALSLCGLSVAV